MHREHDKSYYRCPRCELTFLLEEDLPDLESEKERYERHKNDLEDKGYREFIGRLVKAMLPYLRAGAQGLDFGSGLVHLAALLFHEEGYEVASYDPFFAADRSLLERQYDFISCNEVVEHLHRPRDTFKLLDRLLRPGGVLGIQTGVLEKDEDFKGWWYTRDFTHVAFYKNATFQWIGNRLGWRVLFPNRNVVLCIKDDSVTTP